MTFNEFHNALRVLSSIDYPEFDDAIRPVGGHLPGLTWSQFRDNPWAWFIRVPTAQAQAVWNIVERRMTESSDAMLAERKRHD